MRSLQVVFVALNFSGVLAVSLVPFTSTAVSLTDLFNNQAASVSGSGGNFDGSGSSYDVTLLPTGVWTYDGISYELPWDDGTHGGNDNVVTQSQALTLPEPTTLHEIHMLYALDSTQVDTAKTFVFHFADQSAEEIQMSAKAWWQWPEINLGVINTPYSFVNQTSVKNLNATSIFQWSASVPSRSALESITLPPDTEPGSRLHIFAISITPSAPSSSENVTGLILSIRRAQFSTRWAQVNETRAQAVQVTLANLLPISALSANTSINSPYTIEISGPTVSTVVSGTIKRLVPSDQVSVDVLVITNGTSNATVTIKDEQGTVVGLSGGWPAMPIPAEWTADPELLGTHETPTWYNQAKYGIFVHWGVYSVPAWAPEGTYAEWYNWDLHNPPNSGNPFYVHQLDTYGPSVVYDDFIANFTASKFNASAWVDLFDSAGAKYFVLVTKHHDGFALFDTGNTTHRGSVYMGPQRDLLAELFHAAKEKKPWLHRGTYYSMPEWFSPDYAPYGFSEWPGGLARNVFYPSELEPYTGRLNISDYLADLQLPHMLTLAETYETEIMWCDIGGPNRTPEFAAQFYNNAMAKGLQVAINNRCGAVPDFFTPEYQTLAAIQTQKWETNEGMDPFSYGLNSNTNASQYKNATTIIQTLVDVVSKNGNYLLDVGPTAEGEIIAPMANNLLAAGEWLGSSGGCVYNTSYWFKGAQDSVNGTLRFLTTPDTFCIVSLVQPSQTLSVNTQIPILLGDEIVYLGDSNTEVSPLAWSTDPNTGYLTVDLNNVRLNPIGGAEAWAFQVRYKAR
ncbi:glycoside hydrolase family 29 protein [Neolentinus lepideus HHB14362 ss-1]|uniref:alpha-L-fucosidase n=1 Tax=Neolentinus lepideus HHB14362 ss-1 TaxID=1314782 RepID=A0A165QHG9_9AGAM|nr:glycoside hydrolase family 29 protein [Neolentinus lepideus HHB14362 ss-1]